MQYMTAKEAAQKWNITVRRVQALCSHGRVEGVIRIGNIWAIPKDVKKPFDARIKRR